MNPNIEKKIVIVTIAFNNIDFIYFQKKKYRKIYFR